VVALFKKLELAAKVFRSDQAAVLLWVGNLIGLGQDAVIGDDAKAAAIRAPAKVSAIGQPRIHHTLQNRAHCQHLIIGPHTPNSEEYHA